MKFVKLIVVALSIVSVCWYCSSCSVKNRSTPSEQDFLTFLEQFGSDSLFQSKHIKYPLPYYYYSDDSDELISKSIDRRDWKFIDFSDDGLGRNLSENAFDVDIEKRDSMNVTYSLRGIDNGIMISYDFTVLDGQWTLIKMTNASD